MAKIARAVEGSFDYSMILKQKKSVKQVSVTNAISHATSTTAIDLNAKAIIASTSGGYTARMISSYRPASPIIATTNDKKTYYQTVLFWGVYPLLTPEMKTAEDIINVSVEEAMNKNLIEVGDLVVITAGVPVGKSGSTNLLRIHIASQTLAKGIGIGNGNVSGVARIAKGAETKINKGEILVATTTDKDMIEQIRNAAAVVTEVGGLTSHAAIVGLSLGIPVVVSAQGILEKIVDGEVITVDSATGIVYGGAVKTV